MATMTIEYGGYAGFYHTLGEKNAWLSSHLFHKTFSHSQKSLNSDQACLMHLKKWQFF